MKNSLIVIVTVVTSIMMLTGAAPALAITYGVPDDDGHPNVGVLVYEIGGTKFGLCSGTLISQRVFLTAGHCTAYLSSLGINTVWVSFDAVFTPDSPNLVSGDRYVTDPAYGHDSANPNDLAVVVLSEDVKDIIPASLPTLGLLDKIGHRGLRRQQFTTVGYGDIQPTIGHGPPVFWGFGTRMVATSTFNALNKNWLRLSGNNATGNGGTCYGDSGGPNFLVEGGKETLVAITVTGDAMCLATNVDYRLDTPSARAFLEDFVEQP